MRSAGESTAALVPLLATSVATSKRMWLLTSRVSVAIASVRNAGVRCNGLRGGFEGKAKGGSRD